MKVLGVDLGAPGGLAIVEGDGRGQPSVLWVEAISPRASGLDLQRQVRRLVRLYRVELVATERPGAWGRVSIGMAQREKQGLVRAVCEELGLRLAGQKPRQTTWGFQPSEVKKALTGNGRASKEQVAKMVRAITGFWHDDEHVMDAVAIGLLALNRGECPDGEG